MADDSDHTVVVVERGGLGQFFLGALMGAGLALLFAPQTGEDTRRNLKNQGRQLRAAAGEKVEGLQETLGGNYERTRDRIEEGIETATKTVKDTADAGKSAIGSAREELERKLDEARSARKGEDGNGSGE